MNAKANPSTLRNTPAKSWQRYLAPPTLPAAPRFTRLHVRKTNTAALRLHTAPRFTQPELLYVALRPKDSPEDSPDALPLPYVTRRILLLAPRFTSIVSPLHAVETQLTAPRGRDTAYGSTTSNRPHVLSATTTFGSSTTAKTEEAKLHKTKTLRHIPWMGLAAKAQ